MSKLTKRVVEGLKAGTKDYFLWDAQIAGFGVRVMPSGAKTYQAQYRKGGRTRRVAIGRHGKITADQARKLAQEIMGEVAKGANPAEDLSRLRKAPSIAALCERFFEAHAMEHCKPSTQGEYRRAIDLFIVPALGRFRVVDVARKDISELHLKHRDKPYQANRTLGVLSKMFTLAEVWGLRPDGSNPCRHVPKYREEKRERFLTGEELQQLGAVLEQVEQSSFESVYVVAAFRLLILTGCRLSEIQTLKWEYITPAGMELPDTKTGARRIPGPPAPFLIKSRVIPTTHTSLPARFRANTSLTYSAHGGAFERWRSCPIYAFMTCAIPMHPMLFPRACPSKWSVNCLAVHNCRQPCATPISPTRRCDRPLKKTRHG